MYSLDYKGSNLTITLILVNIIIYFLAGIIGGNIIILPSSILIALGEFNYLVWRGAYYQILTAMFIHLNLIHLGLNMFWLYFLGKSIERIFGYRDYLIIYFGGGILGNILTLIMFPPYTLSVGASGAVFSLFGALIMYSGTFGGNVKSALFYALIILILNMGFGVNYIAHAAGLFVGLLYGYYKGKSITRRFYYEYRFA